MIIVTGGAGFIGSNLVAELDERGHDVIVCDVLGTENKWKNIAKRALADVIPPDRLAACLEANAGAVEAVFHMGAVSATTERDLDLIVERNIRASIDLWDWCALNGARLIHASSAATYGDGANGFNDSDDGDYLARLRPLNPYGWSKHFIDRRISRTVARGGPAPPQWASLKFFNVYGPNEYHKGDMASVVARLYPEVAAGNEARLFKSHRPDYADGGQTRDFIYVKDCVDIMMFLLDNPGVSGLFNAGTGKGRSFADLARAVFDAAGKPEKIVYSDMPEHLRDKYQYYTQADMGKLVRAGYKKPFTSLEDGVRDYVENYLSKEDRYK